MIKRFFSLSLILAILISMIVLPTPAAITDTTALTDPCPCECGASLSEVEWQPWNVNAEGNPATGHYYLKEDYVQLTQKTIGAGSRIVLDLRGHKLTQQDEGKLYLLYGYMAVLDSVGGGCISTSPKEDENAGVFMVYYNDTGVGELELYSGIITTENTGKGSQNGGLIWVGADCTFNMYGGMLLNGKTDGNGGAVYGSSKSTIEITGGSIIGCTAGTNGGSIYSSGNVSIKDSKIWGGTAQNCGGNIYKSGGMLTVDNCDIAYGTCYAETSTQYGGGNIFSNSSATLDIKNNTVIRDGYTAHRGGNIYFTSGTQTFTNTTITGGVAAEYGANVACFEQTAVTIFDGCTIIGDVRYKSGSLTLKGATKISLNSNGLDVTELSMAINASGLTEGAEVFVSADGVFTTDSTTKDYFKPAIRTGEITVDATTGGLTASQVASGDLGGYCPHCNQRVTWTRFGTESDKVGCDANHNLYAGHYYMDADTAYVYNLNANIDFVLDLNGKTMDVNNRVFKVGGNNASLSILDSAGGGVLSGKGTNNSSGGVIYSSGYSFKLNIYGGKIVRNINANKVVTSGGVISVAGKSGTALDIELNIHGGLIDGSLHDNTSTDIYGGAIFFGNVGGAGKSFTMTAGRIFGGSTYYAGSVYIGQDVDASITGGVISGGSATVTGGNLYCKGNTATNSLEISNCAIIGGTADSNGGNAHIEYKDGTISNCYIAGGITSGYGGNLRTGSKAILEISDSILSGGSAKNGGNIYVAATDSELTFDNCTVINGKATGGNGGNIFFNNGKNTVKGSAILYGMTSANGGNIHTNAGNHADGVQFTKILADDEGNVPLICGGYAGDNGGNINTKGVTELTSAYIGNGRADGIGKDIYLDNGETATKLTIHPGVTGNISLGVASSQLTSPLYGTAIGDTASTAIAASITLEGDYDQPAVVAKNGKLYVGGVSVVDGDGREIWYAENSEAISACGDNQYVKLYTDNNLVLTKDCVVDLNGHSVNIVGTGKLYGMDSSSDNYKNATGTATWTDVQSVNTQPMYESFKAPNGNTYFSITDGATATYHRLDMAISNVALVPNRQGIFYRGKWDCDSALAALVDSYGVTVSVNNMPTADFRTETDGANSGNDNFWTQLSGTTLEAGSYSNSLLIENIMKTANEVSVNKTNGEMEIYTTAYITFHNGTTLISDEPGTEDDVNYSLHSLLDLIDLVIDEDPHSHNQYEKILQEYYEDWLDHGMGDWSFRRLNLPEVSGPLCDGKTLRILAITSSFGLNTTQLLYDIAEAEGCENIIVGRLYASGCSLKVHDANAKDNIPAYDYTKNESGAWTTRLNTTMEYGLLDEDWDIIFLQQSASKAPLVDTYGTYIDSIMEYVNKTKTNPTARFVWNMTWAYQGDSTQSVFVDTFHSDQMAMYESILSVTKEKVAGRTDFDAIIPTGTAIQNARTSYFGDTLTKDTYHLNNLGRAIAGYTVWAILTGKPLTEVNLGPVNSYDLPAMLNLSDKDRLVIKDAVNKAIEKPYEVTDSAYPTE